MTDTRAKCPVCNGKGIDYGETCLTCGGQGRVPFREHGRERDEDQTPEELAEEQKLFPTPKRHTVSGSDAADDDDL